eukprot:1661107-Prymnesium_polylepis.1
MTSSWPSARVGCGASAWHSVWRSRTTSCRVSPEKYSLWLRIWIVSSSETLTSVRSQLPSFRKAHTTPSTPEPAAASPDSSGREMFVRRRSALPSTASLDVGLRVMPGHGP